jgi:tyrosyl-tRNA synthetase
MSETSPFPPVDEQMQAILRGADEVFPEDELRKKLERSRKTGKPLRVKLGVDPTAPDLTLGNAVPLWKLRTFQDLGHKAIVIIGDYTARVGDPSGRNKLRPSLDEAQVDAFAQTYLDQLDRILDTSEDKLEVHRNGAWFAGMTFMEVMALAGRMTLAQMIERDDFSKRYREQTPISLHEFLYPLMQGWDSVVVKADVELGGTDQRFNLLVGRQFQKQEGQEPQSLVVNPLLAGLDGTKKMSKSAGNYIGVTEPAAEQFGKAMSAPDALLRSWLTCFTDMPQERIDVLSDTDVTHPRQAKEELGKAIVRRYWGDAAAEEAAAGFRKVFTEKKLPDDMPVFMVPADGIGVLQLFVELGFAKSNGEARRLIKQGAAKLDDVRIDDAESSIAASDLPADGGVLKVGKRRFARLVP